MGLLRGGGGGGSMGVFLIPADTVKATIDLAKKQAEEALKKAKEEGDEEEGDKKEGDEGDGDEDEGDDW
jgi:hypothetical protein